MANDFFLTASDYPFEKYYLDYNISNETKDKLEKADILVLPEPYESSKYYFSQEAVSFVKYCKSINKDVETDILADEDKIEVRFDYPVAAVTPGQSAVFYQDEVCLGGGIIETRIQE